ncbi:putative amino acid transporter [Ordospora pajunii]|uniref:putative amino acid transporter n=1 Tax=Ordospora pajunii TaxID=3039483 RepID=UPI0029527D4D|nr:putative amino acid transporter [Ordospora pajunii]KAH9412298.1 putative amino acid transporter [Ordospora pajunii]
MKKNELRKESISIFINLIKTTIGSGILRYPFLFKMYGPWYTIVLTLISALASLFGLWMYIDLNDFYGLDNSMSTIARYIYPPLQNIVNITVSVKCFLVCIAYLVLLKNNVPRTVSAIFGMQDEYPNLCIFVIAVCIFPFVVMHRIDKLRYTSLFGLVAVMALVASSIAMYAKSGDVVAMQHTATSNGKLFGELGSFVFGFTCHQNIFSVQNEMKTNNKTALKLTTFLVLGTASLTYIVFGLASYLALGDSMKENFFENLPDRIRNTVAVFYFFVVMMSIPLQTHPCRTYFLNLFGAKYSAERKYRHLRFVTSLFIIAVALIAAMSVSKMERLCEVIGGSFSALMCFGFASVYHFMAFKHRGIEIRKIMPLFVLLYGMAAFASLFAHP